MVNKKIYGLIFFLSIEIMIIGVLTFGNSFAYPDNAKKVWNVGYRVDSRDTNLIDINTTLEQDQTYEKEIEIYNEGNIDAYFDSIKTIGNVDNLDITLENMDDTIFSDSKKIVVLKVENKGIDALNVDIGVDLLFKELN